MKNEYVMQGDTLNLRLMTLEDSQMIVDWRNEERVRINYVYREKFTLEGQEKYFHDKIESGEVVQLIACEPDGRPIGCTVLNDFHRETGHCEYGMFIGEPDAAGKGYSAVMVRMTLDYAFHVLGYTECVCRIFTDNIPSWKGCCRGGFQIVETLPDVVCTDGTVKDMYLLRATKDDAVSKS